MDCKGKATLAPMRSNKTLDELSINLKCIFDNL